MFTALNHLNKKILTISLSASLAFHAVEFHIFQNQTLWIPGKGDSSKVLQASQKLEKEKILENSISLMHRGHGSQGISQSTNQSQILQSSASLQAITTSEPSLKSASFAMSDLQSSFPKIKLQNLSPKLPGVALSHKDVRLISHIPKKPVEKISTDNAQESNLNQDPKLLELSAVGSNFFTENSPRQKVKAEIPAESTLKFLNPLIEKKAPSIEPKRGASCNLPSLQDLHCKSLSNSFATDLVFFELQKGKYVFALTLIPKEEFSAKPLKQNLYFLIDKSNSIQKERLKATKIAIKKAIEELSPSDHFNIFSFDQKVDKLSHKSLLASKENKEKAYAFLEEISLGSFFSKKDLFNPLFLTVPPSVHEEETHTAILFTDGDNLEKMGHKESLSQGWSSLNQGKVSLYTFCLDTDNQTETLSALCQYNKGKLLLSPTLKGFRRKLLKLLKTIQTPIARELSCKAITKKGTIETFPKPSNAPPMYMNEPYTIVGTTENLEDFTLFIQGKCDEQWLHIKKKISFKTAKKANQSLKSLWAQYKSFDLYDTWLTAGNEGKIAEMKDLIKTYDLPELFEKF